jgi:hypothetical protein
METLGPDLLDLIRNLNIAPISKISGTRSPLEIDDKIAAHIDKLGIPVNDNVSDCGDAESRIS